jgi:predicted RNA-binding Zn-ribbon protein involved in translation (DUF1610 family)
MTQDRERVGTRHDVAEVAARLDPETQVELARLLEKSETAEDFFSAAMGSQCPECGSLMIESCEDVRGIENFLIDRCKECGTLICSECGGTLEDGQFKVHEVCPVCGSTNTDFAKKYNRDEEENDDDEDSDPDDADLLDFDDESVGNCFDCGASVCMICGRVMEADAESSDL